MFSLRTLLIAVAIAAIGAAALATRSLWWAGAMMMVTLAILATAVLLAIAHQGKARPTALGFVIFAGFYALVTWSNVFEPLKYSLPTTRAIAAAWESLEIEKPVTGSLFVSQLSQDGSERIAQEYEYPGVDDEQYASNPSLLQTPLPMQTQYYNQVLAFFTVSRCLFTLAFGFLGAMLGTYLYTRNNAVPRSSAPVP